MPICVTGMGRSGTSMVAQLLAAAGVYAGPEEEFAPPAPDNEEGFWENLGFVRLNDELLDRLGGAWDVPAPALGARWGARPDLEDLRERARALAKPFTGHEPWFWKDPRTSLTMPFWQEIFPDLRVVICVRNPLDVAGSLGRRGYASPRFSFGLWLAYNRELLAATTGSVRVVTHYDAYFDDALRELNRVLDFLGVAPSAARDAAVARVAPRLRHSAATRADLVAFDAPLAVQRTYDALCEEAQLPARDTHDDSNGADLAARGLRRERELQTLLSERRRTEQSPAASQSTRAFRYLRPLRNAYAAVTTRGRESRLAPARATDAESPKLDHRAAVGGLWEEIGQLQFDFLVERGLLPNHFLLDIGCGSLRGGVHFIRYLLPGRYFGIDRDAHLLDAGRRLEAGAALLAEKRPTFEQMDDFAFERLGQTFEFALAQSLFTHLPLNAIVRCLANVERALRPDGTLYATFFEHPNGKNDLSPVNRNGIVTHFDADPYHYDVGTFEWACGGTTLTVEYIGDWGHPRGQKMVAFHKAA